MSSLDMTDVDRIVAETDMIAFIDAAICTVGAFGFATSQETEQSQAMDTIMNCLEEAGLERKYMLKMETMLSDLQIAAEKEAFKRGFNIALRILIEGLNAGKND